VIELFQSSGLPITSLEYAKPTLESVFLQLTGKRLRN
jgi:hypothetical protein